MLPGKKPVYTRLAFTVQGHATLESLVKMLEDFYRTSLLHQVKNISIQRPVTVGPQQKQGELDVNLTVEALIVNGAENRQRLMPGVDRRLALIDVVTTMRGGPSGMALGAWAVGPTGPLGPRTLAQPPREYAAIARKNIFFGPTAEERGPAAELGSTRFVFLTDITRTPLRYEAYLYDRSNNRQTRLRSSRGFDAFRITDKDGGTRVQGQVIHIDSRDLIFRVGEKYYTMHLGQNLEQAMERPLPSEQVDYLTKGGGRGPGKQ
jgi:hypothetical protein